MGSVPFGVIEATGETRSELTLSLAFSSTSGKFSLLHPAFYLEGDQCLASLVGSDILPPLILPKAEWTEVNINCNRNAFARPPFSSHTFGVPDGVLL